MDAESGLKDILAERVSLLKRIEDLKADLALLDMEINEKFAKTFEEKRGKTGKEYGAVTASIEGYQVKQTVGKTVTWDQDKLEAIAQKIGAAGDNPNEWMVKTWKVKEKEFKDWAPEIRAVFLPARTVKPKAATYAFKEIE